MIPLNVMNKVEPWSTSSEQRPPLKLSLANFIFRLTSENDHLSYTPTLNLVLIDCTFKAFDSIFQLFRL